MMGQTECKTKGEAICERLIAEIHKLGFPPEILPTLPDYHQAGFSTAKDTFSGVDSVIGIWKNRQGYRIGEIKLHGDGSFYAEYDIALQHPKDARWFVEAVVAWGRDDVIRTEAKLLPALGQ
ncbi:MAG: hypothetical protein ACOYMG_19035 [Candidatus Methylumidiphilus sp.]